MKDEDYGFGARIERRGESVGAAFDPKTVRLAFDRAGDAVFGVIDGASVDRESPLYAMLSGVVFAELAAAFLTFPETMLNKTPVEVFSVALARTLQAHGFDVHIEIAVSRRTDEPQQNAPGNGSVN